MSVIPFISRPGTTTNPRLPESNSFPLSSSTTPTAATSHLPSAFLIDRIETAFANNDLEQLLIYVLDNGVNSNFQRKGTGNTPLILAVRHGDEEAVTMLLSLSNTNPNLANHSHRSPLMCAAASGHEHIITLLLIEMAPGQERMHMLFQQDSSGKNALDWARIGRRSRCIRTLELAIARSIQYCRSERNASKGRESLRLLVEENRARRVLIQHAILNRDTESLQDLARPLEHAHLQWDASNKVMTLASFRRGDFRVDEKSQTQTETKETSAAASNTETGFEARSAFEAERPTLGKGIIVGVANRAALEHAVDEMMTDGSRIVNAAPPSDPPTPLIEFAHPNRHVLFADHECMGGITPLMYAAGNDLPDLITLLVRRAGADINLKSTRMGHTPLTWAACSGALSTVQVLLSEGAELDLPTSEGRTALMVACSRANKHMVGTLLECCMHLAQRRASRDADAQYNSLVRVLGHEIASQARYSNAGKESEGWQHYFDALVFGMKDQDGRNAVVHARMSGGGKYNPKRSGSSSTLTVGGSTVGGPTNGRNGSSSSSSSGGSSSSRCCCFDLA